MAGNRLNVVEFEEAVSGLAVQPFERVELRFMFRQAFGNEVAGIQGQVNSSEVLHIVVLWGKFRR